VANPDETRRLQELQDAYAWQVNAAIARGREDLAWELADEYVAEAMVIMTGRHLPGCTRPGCEICAGLRSLRPQVTPYRDRHHGWLRRFFIGH
jgi:hypothetical protein